MIFHAAEFRFSASRMLADVSANDLRSLGKLCADLRVPYHVLAETVEALRIAPALVLNGVRHYDAPAVARITTAVAATSAPVPPTSQRAASCAPDPANVPTPRHPAPHGRRRRGEKPHDRLSPSLEGAVPQ